MMNITPNSIAAIVVGLLITLLLMASFKDFKSYKISNKLILTGTSIGVLANSFLPEGNGFVSALPGALGLLSSIAGLATGLALLLPLYLTKGMGAGDVKLVAMVGAFLGATTVFSIIILTFVIGGFLAFGVAIRKKTFVQLFKNLWMMVLATYFKVALKEAPTIDMPSVSAGKLPYAIPITLGVVSYIYLIYKYPNLSQWI